VHTSDENTKNNQHKNTAFALWNLAYGVVLLAKLDYKAKDFISE
jgi:hypothetical protein